jgi:hypothetical protein
VDDRERGQHPVHRPGDREPVRLKGGHVANFFYANAVQLWGEGQIDWRAIDARAVLVNEFTGHYVPDAVGHLYLSDIAAVDRLATTDALTGKVVLPDGVLDADNAILPAVSSGLDELGAPIIGSAIVIYQVSGGEGTSPLLLHIDEMAGLPIEPNGTVVDLIWNEGADRIARL